MTTSHPCHTFSFEDRPPPYCRAKKLQKKALLYLTFRLICFFHGHVSFEHPLSSKNFKNIPRYWNEIILLIRLNCNCSIENLFVLRIILQRKWQYKQTLTEVVGDEKGIQQGFMRRCSYPRSNPLSFYIPYLKTESASLVYFFIKNSTPFLDRSLSICQNWGATPFPSTHIILGISL